MISVYVILIEVFGRNAKLITQFTENKAIWQQQLCSKTKLQYVVLGVDRMAYQHLLYHEHRYNSIEVQWQTSDRLAV